MSGQKEMPPVPPANRSQKGPGDDSQSSKDAAKPKSKSVDTNIEQQGDRANVKQNTTNQMHRVK